MKKTLAAVLAAALIFSAASCAANTPAAESPSPSAAASPPPKESSAPPPSPSPEEPSPTPVPGPMEYISFVYYDGRTYVQGDAPEGAEPGAELGSVDTDLRGYGMNIIYGITASPTLPVGTALYELAGESPERTVCALAEDGSPLCFYGLSVDYPYDVYGNTLAHLMLRLSAIESVRIEGENEEGCGELYEAESASALVRDMVRRSEFISAEEYESVWEEMGERRSLVIRFTDGEKSQIKLWGEGNAAIREYALYMKLPDDFMDSIYAAEIYPSGDARTSFSSLHTGEYWYMYASEEGGWRDEHEVGQVWISAGALYMGDCSNYVRSREDKTVAEPGYAKLADGASGCVHMEAPDIWYLTDAGAGAHMRFEAPGLEYPMIKNSGEDITGFISEHEIIYDGPFTDLQVRNGVVWTLDKGGTLRRDGETAATGVADFAIDAAGVSFCAAGGLYRQCYGAEEPVLLAAGSFTEVAAAYYLLYYAEADGSIYRIRVDGTRAQPYYKMEGGVTGMSYARRNTYSEGLAFLSGGAAYLLLDAETLYTVAEAATAVTFAPWSELYYLHENGDISIFYEY